MEDSLERPYYEDFTESKDIVRDNTERIIKATAEAKGIAESEIDKLKILSVLGARWDTLFIEAFEDYSKRTGKNITLEVGVFDNNETQIKESGYDVKGVFMNLGTEEGDADLDEKLQESVDVLNLSNIPDKIDKRNMEGIFEAIEISVPPVVMFSGGEKNGQERDTFVHFLEGVENIGYKVDITETPRSKRIEVPYQAIATLS